MINDEASIILANISTFSGITIASKNEKYEAQTFQRKASKLAESGWKGKVLTFFSLGSVWTGSLQVWIRLILRFQLSSERMIWHSN